MSIRVVRHLEWFRWFAIAISVVLGVSAVVFSRAVVASNEALEQVMRYDVAWSGAQGRTEAAELERRVMQLALSPDEESLKAAVLAHQILLSRIRTWGAGDFGRFLDRHPRMMAYFNDLVEESGSLGELLHQLAGGGAEERLTASLISKAGAVRYAVDRLGMGAHTRSVSETARVRDELKDRQSTQKVLIIILFLVGFALILLTSWQKRSLARANAATVATARSFAFLAHHDALTSLPNRTAFNTAFGEAVDCIGRDGTRAAVLAIDLDGFKAINDSLGHAAGDALLISVADRLRDEISARDPRNVISRFGGDEFVILLYLPDGTDSAIECARRLREILREPHATSSGLVVIDATIGVAVSGPDRSANLRLPLDADLALTQAKADGKGTILAFGAQMRRIAGRRIQLETDLAAAIRLGEIQPFYQPQVDLGSGRVVGVEALARWKHRDHGWISPEEFIPIAEASGQIIDIGHAILETACRHALAFPMEIPVSVNLSVAQLVREDLVDALIARVRDSGLPSHRLTFEVTESMVMKDAELALSALARIKQHGIKIALDDFGMGYSALSYLRRFEWDQLKIDRSFIQAMCDDPHSYSIVKTVISLARQLGIEVIAEGVAGAAQQRLLRRAGCRTVQGFLFSKPVPVTELGQAFLGCVAASNPQALALEPELSADPASRARETGWTARSLAGR